MVFTGLVLSALSMFGIILFDQIEQYMRQQRKIAHQRASMYAPLHITIRTRQTDAGSEIIVEDNGPGFAPADNQEPHIALANIRERLQMQGGKLMISPREGGGTIVKVTIP